MLPARYNRNAMIGMRITCRLLPIAALVLLLGTGGCSKSKVWGSQLFHTAPDGTSLAGTYLRPQGPELAPVFILLHQPGQVRNRNDFDAVWYPLSERGLALLAPDLRGHGASEDVSDLAALSHDPLGYPVDLDSWLQFLQYRRDEGDLLDLDRIAIIGLSTSASLAAAAIGTGRGHCGVAVSARISEVNALAAGFLDGDGSGDDDDSALGGGGDDDDSSASDNSGIDPALAMHDIRWIYAGNDEASAADSRAMFGETDGYSDVVELPGDAHGVELLWNSPEANDSLIEWCLSRL